MKIRVTGLMAVVAAGLVVAACSGDNPARPSMSFAAPVAQQPANGLAYNFNEQPIRLQVVNSVRTGSANVTYDVSVARDASFSSVVFSADGVGEDGSGVTTVQLPELEGNQTYHWRWRAVVDGIAGEYSAPREFFLRPNIILGVPGVRQPAAGTAAYGNRPVFIVSNSTVEGPAGTISYQFEVSASAAFSPLIATQTVSAGQGETSWIPPVDLPEGKLFWRARARDVVNNVDGPFTDAVEFERRFGIDLDNVVYALGPNISKWPQTTTITEAYKTGDVLCTFYDAQWPWAPFLGDPSVPVVANQWVFVEVNGVWYGGAGHWMRPNQYCKSEFDDHFFVDGFAGRPPFNSLVLRPGTVFGVAVSTPARFYPNDKTLDQRSDVKMVVW